MLTREQAAERYGISVNTLDRLVAAHSVPVLRFGRRVVFDPQALTALESACRYASPPAKIPEPFGLSGRSARPARKPESAFASVLERLTQGSRGKPRRP